MNNRDLLLLTVRLLEQDSRLSFDLSKSRTNDDLPLVGELVVRGAVRIMVASRLLDECGEQKRGAQLRDSIPKFLFDVNLVDNSDRELTKIALLYLDSINKMN